jgi:hypothetical protein
VREVRGQHETAAESSNVVDDLAIMKTSIDGLYAEFTSRLPHLSKLIERAPKTVDGAEWERWCCSSNTTTDMTA